MRAPRMSQLLAIGVIAICPRGTTCGVVPGQELSSIRIQLGVRSSAEESQRARRRTEQRGGARVRGRTLAHKCVSSRRRRRPRLVRACTCMQCANALFISAAAHSGQSRGGCPQVRRAGRAMARARLGDDRGLVAAGELLRLERQGREAGRWPDGPAVHKRPGHPRPACIRAAAPPPHPPPPTPRPNTHRHTTHAPAPALPPRRRPAPHCTNPHLQLGEVQCHLDDVLERDLGAGARVGGGGAAHGAGRHMRLALCPQPCLPPLPRLPAPPDCPPAPARPPAAAPCPPCTAPRTCGSSRRCCRCRSAGR